MRVAPFFCSLLLVASASVCAQNISIATGGTGGVYYPMGGGLANVLSKHVPGMQATAEVTGGSVDNLNLIGSGKPYVAFSMVDAVLDAAKIADNPKAAAKICTKVPAPTPNEATIPARVPWLALRLAIKIKSWPGTKLRAMPDTINNQRSWVPSMLETL